MAYRGTPISILCLLMIADCIQNPRACAHHSGVTIHGKVKASNSTLSCDSHPSIQDLGGSQQWQPGRGREEVMFEITQGLVQKMLSCQNQL